VSFQASLYERVVAHWKSESLQRNPAVGLNALDQFESRHGLKLPVSLRRLLLLSNGLVEGQYDPANYIRFCAIEEFALQTFPAGSDPGGRESYLVFAEFSIWAHSYAVSTVSGVVAVIGGRLPIRVADSLEEFLLLYLENSPALFPKPE
jgi:hypothetical protein